MLELYSTCSNCSYVFKTDKDTLFTHGGIHCHCARIMPSVQFAEGEWKCMHCGVLYSSKAIANKCAGIVERIPGEKRIYHIPCTWSMCGEMSVEAESVEEAIDLARDLPLPEPGDYMDDSFEIGHDTIVYSNSGDIFTEEDRRYLGLRGSASAGDSPRIFAPYDVPTAWTLNTPTSNQTVPGSVGHTITINI